MPNLFSSKLNDLYPSLKGWEIDSFFQLKRTHEKYYKKIIQKIKVDTKKKLNILEIGYGMGSFLRFCNNLDWDLSGVEINESLRMLAEKKSINVKDSINYDWKRKFDLVAAFDVLEHIEREGLLPFLLTIDNLLEIDGHFVATFPNADSPFGLYNQNGDATHVNSIGKGMIKSLVAQTNMSVEYLGGEIQPIFSGNIYITVIRIFMLPIKAVINSLVSIGFFDLKNKGFCSQNTTVILKKIDVQL